MVENFQLFCYVVSLGCQDKIDAQLKKVFFSWWVPQKGIMHDNLIP